MNLPSQRLELSLDPRVARYIFREFLLPERGVAGRRRRVPAARVSMPETSVHEQGNSIPGKDQVGLAWQSGMQAKAKSGAMQKSSNGQLGRGVLAANPGHHPASRGPIDDIHGVRPRATTFAWPVPDR